MLTEKMQHFKSTENHVIVLVAVNKNIKKKTQSALETVSFIIIIIINNNCDTQHTDWLHQMFLN